MLESQYIRNLFFDVEDIPNNPLVHIFLYITLAFGLSFVFFADPTGASSTFLYKLTVAQIDGIASNLWGIACIVTAATNTLSLIFRRKWLGITACWMGFFIWGFALWIYLFGGFVFGALVVSLPNLMFWGWQYVQVNKYHREYHSGLYPARKDAMLETNS